MTPPRLHLTGASCAGVSTLGTALAQHLHVPHWDVDDFYWMPTDPPFTTKRPAADRVHAIQARLAQTPGWVLSGSCMNWGETLIDGVSLIVFVQTPTAVRLQRLDQRERRRHGDRILPGGDMHEAHLAFRDWASRYDDPMFTGRNAAQHERWLRERGLPIARVAGDRPTQDLVQAVVQAWQAHVS